MIGVLIVDDSEAVRITLAGALRCHPDMDVRGLARNGQVALEQAQALRPDVVLMDISMPGTDGVEATYWLKRALPAARVIGLSVHGDPGVIAAMQGAGAVAFVAKDAPFGELVACIRRVAGAPTPPSPPAFPLVGAPTP